MFRPFCLWVFSLTLTVVILFLFTISTIAITTLAIPTDRKTIVVDSWDIGKLFNSFRNIYSLTSDFSGNIYFAEHNANKIARLSPDTNTITELTIPTNSSGPTDVAFDSLSSNIYFAEHNANKI